MYFNECLYDSQAQQNLDIFAIKETNDIRKTQSEQRLSPKRVQMKLYTAGEHALESLNGNAKSKNFFDNLIHYSKSYFNICYIIDFVQFLIIKVNSKFYLALVDRNKKEILEICKLGKIGYEKIEFIQNNEKDILIGQIKENLENSRVKDKIKDKILKNPDKIKELMLIVANMKVEILQNPIFQNPDKPREKILKSLDTCKIIYDKCSKTNTATESCFIYNIADSLYKDKVDTSHHQEDHNIADFLHKVDTSDQDGVLGNSADTENSIERILSTLS
jgi:hypothetical protein